MPRTSAATAKCPRAEHSGSRVKLDGTYGRPGRRRQRYKCSPRRGKPHVFTELLPREESWHDSCEQCERHVERREGPKAPRHYQFVARGVAEALQAVGAGATYMRASRVARDRAHRFRFDAESGELRESDHGQLVADWVEVFAPVVFELHRPAAWPEAGSLLVDDLPFSVRDPATGRFRIAFRVFCAAGFERGRPKLWRVEAFPDASQANWEAFLGALEGAPGRVVCDNHSGLNAAVRAAFPDAELYLCEWHLRHALERLMAKIRKSDEHRDAVDALLPRVEAAFTGPAFWEPFLRDAHAAEIPRLSDWLDGAGRIVSEQFARRGLRSQRPADMPLSTSPMDGLIEPIRAAIHPRRYGLKNRERTNRLLLLMQLHANRQDDVLAYAKSIRSWLEANGGRPRIARRAVTDPGGLASLR